MVKVWGCSDCDNCGIVGGFGKLAVKICGGVPEACCGIVNINNSGRWQLDKQQQQQQQQHNCSLNEGAIYDFMGEHELMDCFNFSMQRVSNNDTWHVYEWCQRHFAKHIRRDACPCLNVKGKHPIFTVFKYSKLTHLIASLPVTRCRWTPWTSWGWWCTTRARTAASWTGSRCRPATAPSCAATSVQIFSAQPQIFSSQTSPNLVKHRLHDVCSYFYRSMDGRLLDCERGADPRLHHLQPVIMWLNHCRK